MDDFTSNVLPLSRVKTTSTQERDCAFYGGLNIWVMQVKANIGMFVGGSLLAYGEFRNTVYRDCRGWYPPPIGEV